MRVETALLLLFAAVVVTIVVHRIDERTGLPAAALLTLIGIGVSLFVAGATLAAGMALGAAVAPPDPVAALAVGRKVGLPPRLLTLIQGEGLLNDATAVGRLPDESLRILQRELDHQEGQLPVRGH